MKTSHCDNCGREDAEKDVIRVLDKSVSWPLVAWHEINLCPACFSDVRARCGIR